MRNLKRELEIEALKLATVDEEQKRALEAMEASEDMVHVLKLMKCRDWFQTNLRTLLVLKYGSGTLPLDLLQFEDSCVRHIQDIDKELCAYQAKYMNKVQQKVIEEILKGLNFRAY